MFEVKDSGKELHISRPRIFGLVFGLFALPVFLACAAFEHLLLGFFLYLCAGIGLAIAYQMTPLGKFMRGLIPTATEKTGRSRKDQN